MEWICLGLLLALMRLVLAWCHEANDDLTRERFRDCDPRDYNDKMWEDMWQ